MPFSSCRPPAGLPRSCCRQLLLPGGAAGGSSRGTDGVVLGRGAITLQAPNPFGWQRLRPQILSPRPPKFEGSTGPHTPAQASFSFAEGNIWCLPSS